MLLWNQNLALPKSHGLLILSPPLEQAARLKPLALQTTPKKPDWVDELLQLHHEVYPNGDPNKLLVGVAMSVAPRPAGELFEKTLASIPAYLPVVLHSRLNYSVSSHPQICHELRAMPVYQQLEDPTKLNHFVHYRATKAMDKPKRTIWRSKIVLDNARTISTAEQFFHYVIYVEDDVLASPAFFSRLPELIRDRIRMDVPKLFAEDKAAGKVDYLTHRHRDPQDHKYANGEPWAMLWLAGQGMLGVMWDARYLKEAVDAMVDRFDEKPLDWLVRQIKHDKQWNTPCLREGGYFSHLGVHSTFADDKRQRQTGKL